MEQPAPYLPPMYRWKLNRRNDGRKNGQASVRLQGGVYGWVNNSNQVSPTVVRTKIDYDDKGRSKAVSVVVE
jgi:hypothetical protein